MEVEVFTEFKPKWVDLKVVEEVVDNSEVMLVMSYSHRKRVLSILEPTLALKLRWPLWPRHWRLLTKGWRRKI